MQINHVLLSLALGICLCGFGSCSQNVKQPEKVYITVEKLPELTEEDRKALADCPITEPTTLTTEEAVRVAKARRAALVDCNVDKKTIRSWFDGE